MLVLYICNAIFDIYFKSSIVCIKLLLAVFDIVMRHVPPTVFYQQNRNQQQVVNCTVKTLFTHTLICVLIYMHHTKQKQGSTDKNSAL